MFVSSFSKFCLVSPSTWLTGYFAWSDYFLVPASLVSLQVLFKDGCSADSRLRSTAIRLLNVGREVQLTSVADAMKLFKCPG